MGAPDPDLWLKTAADRLTGRKFRLTDGVSFEAATFRRVAHKSGFQLTKFGNVETFFVFGDVEKPDVAAIRAFSATAFRYAKAAKSFPLPCGLFEAVIAYSVAIVETLDDATSAAIRATAPTKHWAAFEVPVVYDKGRGALCYFEKTPVWGAAYYRGIRKQIEQFLGTGTAS